MSLELLTLSISEVASRVQQGEISAEEVTRWSLERIEALNGSLHAFLTIQPEQAIDSARAIDAKRASGQKLGSLAGVPIGLKDALCTQGAPTTCGSKILTRRAKANEADLDPVRGWLPPYDATVVARLRAADAVLPGKCNMDEFAMGSSNENSAFGPVKNPWDLTRIPGGSSGGSAVAVAANMTKGALGSDTGGSIRQPSSLCGVVGIKPTYGRVSRYGLIAFASSLDQVGPMASDVKGAARLLGVIAGHDERDATSVQAPVDDYEQACSRDIKGMRIGIPEEYFASGLQPEIETCVRAAIGGLEALGCTLVPVSLAHTRYAVAAYYVVATAEASSNLSRFDGVRFGLRVDGEDLGEMYRATRGEGFGPEVKLRIMLGTYVLSAGYYDAYYLRAQKVRTLIRRDFDEAFQKVDVIATPVSPTVAFGLGEHANNPISMYLADTYTLPASMAGLPAISVPCGMASTQNSGVMLPVGLQLIGPALQEARLCALGYAWEQCSPVRGQKPLLGSKT